MVRWHYRDAALLWLFVPAYLAHLAEEFWAAEGFPVWLARLAGRPLPEPAFVAINVVALALMIAGIRAAIRNESYGWIAVAIASVVALNAILHLLGSMAAGAYSPGLITGVVLYVPLGTLTLLRAWHQMPQRTFRLGALAGVGAHAVISALAFAIARS